jgi:hypothetical protein
MALCSKLAPNLNHTRGVQAGLSSWGPDGLGARWLASDPLAIVIDVPHENGYNQDVTTSLGKAIPACPLS